MSTVQKKSMNLGEEKVTYPKFHSQQEIHTTSSFLSKCYALPIPSSRMRWKLHGYFLLNHFSMGKCF